MNEKYYALQQDIASILEISESIPDLHIVEKEIEDEELWNVDEFQIVKDRLFPLTTPEVLSQDQMEVWVYDETKKLQHDRMIPPWGLKFLTYEKESSMYGTFVVTIKSGLYHRNQHEYRGLKPSVTDKEVFHLYYDLVKKTWTRLWLSKKPNKSHQELWDKRQSEHRHYITTMNHYSRLYLKDLYAYRPWMTTNGSTYRSIYSFYKTTYDLCESTYFYLRTLVFQGKLSKLECDKNIERLFELMKLMDEAQLFVKKAARLSTRSQPGVSSNQLLYEYDIVKDLTEMDGYKTRYPMNSAIYTFLEFVDARIRDYFSCRNEEASEEKELIVGSFGASDEEPIIYRTVLEIERSRGLTSGSHNGKKEKQYEEIILSYWRNKQKNSG